MNIIEEAVAKVASGEKKVIYIPAGNKTQQESMRVSGIMIRKRMGKWAMDVGVTKRVIDGMYMLMVYDRAEDDVCMMEMVDGKMVKIESSADDRARRTAAMREDGWTDEQIKEYWEKGE